MKKKLLILMALMLNAPLASSAVLSLAPFSRNADTGDSLYIELNPSLSTVDARLAIHIDPGFDSGVLTFINAVAGDFFISSAEWIDELNAGGITTGTVRSTSAIDGTTGPDQPGVDFFKLEATQLNSLNNEALTSLKFTTPDIDNSAFFLTDTAILNTSFAKRMTGSKAMNVSVSAPSSSSKANSLFLLLGSLILVALALRNTWKYQVLCNIIFLFVIFHYYF